MSLRYFVLGLFCMFSSSGLRSDGTFFTLLLLILVFFSFSFFTYTYVYRIERKIATISLESRDGPGRLGESERGKNYWGFFCLFCLNYYYFSA